MKKQRINPLVGYGPCSIGPYANRIGLSIYARATGPKDKRGDSYLLQENGGKILLEDLSGALLLE